jgi:hypothetical protein
VAITATWDADDRVWWVDRDSARIGMVYYWHGAAGDPGADAPGWHCSLWPQAHERITARFVPVPSRDAGIDLLAALDAVRRMFSGPVTP